MKMVNPMGRNPEKETSFLNKIRSLVCGCPMYQQIEMFGGTVTSRN